MMRIIGMLLVAAVLAGCASYSSGDRERMGSLPQHYSQFDLKMAWEVNPTENGTLVTGEVQNLRYAFMEGIEVWVAVVEASGKLGKSSVSYIIPTRLNQDEIAPFSVTLPVRVEPGTRLRFTYKYRGSDGGDSDGGGAGDWMQSFEAVVPDR